MLPYEQIKNLEVSFGAQAAPLINALEGMGNELRAEITKDMATKDDVANVQLEIAKLRGELKEDMARLEARLEVRLGAFEARLGAMETRFEGRFGAMEARFEGRFGAMEARFARLEVLMKVLIGLSIIGMGLFSPNMAKIIELLK